MVVTRQLSSKYQFPLVKSFELYSHYTAYVKSNFERMSTNYEEIQIFCINILTSE